MRGVVALFVLAILILSLPIQGALAREDHEHEKGDVTNFELNATPQKLTVHIGEGISAIISLEVEDSISGRVQLTLTWDNRVPTDVSYSFSPTSIGAGESSTLSFTTHRDSTIGNFHFHVHGTLGNEVESIRLALKIKQFHPGPDFTVSADPLDLTAMPGGSASSMVIVTGIDGFTSSVDLSLNWEGVPRDVSISFQPSSLRPTGTSNLTLTTSKSTATGIYEFLVIGTSGRLVHESPEMSLNVSNASPPPPPPAAQGDFTLKISPESWTIRAGETIAYNISLAPVNGFNQQVSLNVSPATLAGATVTLSTSTATPPALLQLQIATDTTINPTTYSLTVTATNGSLTHKTTLYMIVLPGTPLPPAVMLTLKLSKENITLRETITASGQVTPTQDHTNIPILILYTNISNINWQLASSGPTNTTAGYALDWTPTQAGTFYVRAVWLGDSTHNGAISNLASLHVTASRIIVPSQPAFPWFWLAIAAIIIIGVATAVTLRIRKKPVLAPTAAST